MRKIWKLTVVSVTVAVIIFHVTSMLVREIESRLVDVRATGHKNWKLGVNVIRMFDTIRVSILICSSLGNVHARASSHVSFSITMKHRTKFLSFKALRQTQKRGRSIGARYLAKTLVHRYHGEIGHCFLRGGKIPCCHNLRANVATSRCIDHRFLSHFPACLLVILPRCPLVPPVGMM